MRIIMVRVTEFVNIRGFVLWFLCVNVIFYFVFREISERIGEHFERERESHKERARESRMRERDL